MRRLVAASTTATAASTAAATATVEPAEVRHGVGQCGAETLAAGETGDELEDEVEHDPASQANGDQPPARHEFADPDDEGDDAGDDA